MPMQPIVETPFFGRGRFDLENPDGGGSPDGPKLENLNENVLVLRILSYRVYSKICAQTLAVLSYVNKRIVIASTMVQHFPLNFPFNFRFLFYFRFYFCF